MQTEIYFGPTNFIFFRPSEQLFGGLLYRIQSVEILKTPIFAIFALVALLIIFERNKKSTNALILLLSMLLSFFVSLRVSSGWDELYINLKHSWVLKEYGIFSYNFMSSGEATVDFLPYFLTGLLGKLGLSLEETIVSINMLGNFLFILLIYKVLRSFYPSNKTALVAALASALFPPMAYVSATGFTAGLFSSLILSAFYFWTTNRRIFCLIVLSLLPLIRMEGILFNFLFWLVWSFHILNSEKFKPHALKKSIPWGIFLVAPLGLLSLWRFFKFGSVIPNPITFKSTGFAHDYIANGLRQFTETLSFFHIGFIVLLSTVLIIYKYSSKKDFSKFEKSLGVFYLISFIFICSYYSGGGDWFPLSWGRYPMPFLVASWILFWVSVTTIITLFPPVKKKNILIIFAFSVLCLRAFSGGVSENYKNDLKHVGSKWERVDNLASLGYLLSLSSLKSDVIAGSEVATIMYFAQRDVLDLLGVANPEIARSPMNPASPGDILHRKRNPSTIYTHNPQFLTFWGSENKIDFDYNTMSNSLLFKFIQETVFNKDMQTIAAYRAGSREKLASLGYRNLSVFVGPRFFNYYVSESAYQRHLAALSQEGIKKVLTYEVKNAIPSDFFEKFPDPRL